MFSDVQTYSAIRPEPGFWGSGAPRRFPKIV